MRIPFGFATTVLAVLVMGQALPPIAFRDITESSGVRFVCDNGATPRKHQPEGLIAGVALFDYDRDGDLDIYLVNGAHMPSLVKQGEKHKNRLFRNYGDGTFTDVTDKAGVGGEGYGMGVAAADYDNDGWPDLYVLNVNDNQLFHNNGDGTFTDVTRKAGVPGGQYKGKKMWSVAAAWFDYDNDGDLDLFVSNYCEWDPNNEPDCLINGVRIYCGPRHYGALPHTLYRNNGDGTFTDVSAEAGLSQALGRGMAIVVADYDDDGWMDVFVGNDDAPMQFFHNLGGKKFREIGHELGIAFSENGNVISGMGADFRDIFNTGRPDIWVTALEKETFPLFVNVGGGIFEDRTAASGLALETLEMSGWSNAIFDLDNDGWKDLIVCRSNVQDMIHTYAPRRPEEPVSVFRNLGNGRFQNLTGVEGSDTKLAANYKGMAIGDLDNDGRMDAVLLVLNGPARVLRNVSPGGNSWLHLELTGTKSNRMGIGAKIKVTDDRGFVQYNHATVSTGYAATSDHRVHFGLGQAKRIRELEIRWPSGVRQVLNDVAVNQILKVREPAEPPASQ